MGIMSALFDIGLAKMIIQLAAMRSQLMLMQSRSVIVLSMVVQHIKRQYRNSKYQQEQEGDMGVGILQQLGKYRLSLAQIN